MLLVVVVAVLAAMAEAVSLNPTFRHASGFQAVPFYIHPPENIQSSQPLDYKHILYSYSFSPTEINIRHRGQNPVRYSVPSNIPYAAPYTQEQNSGFDRGHIEFPGPPAHRAQFASPLNYARPAHQDEEDLDHTPLRDAVESVPLEAQEYIFRVAEEEDEVPFSRSNVESYPHFQTPYSGGVRDDEIQAVVIEVSDGGIYEDDEKFGWVGIRDSVESPPLRTPIQDPEEASPLPVQLNSRPYGIWSEQLLGLSKVAFGPEFDDDNILSHSDASLGYKAGGELANYKATIRSQSGDYKLICYFGGWSVYRPEPFDFSVSDIDPFSCTHVIYSFAGLKKNEHTIISLDEKLDVIQGSYKAAVGLKEQNPALKVMIAIGGWNEGGKKYSRMASSKSNREKFIKSVIAFIKEHGFDGLDLDWEYPGASDRGGSWSDNKNFADLVDELAVAFKPYGWLLSAAVSPARFRVNEGYDVARISKSLDFINIMTYDMRGPWDGKADHHAPISTRPSDTWSFKNLNTKDGMAYWALKGAPKEKLVMGIPFYGRSFTLADPNQNTPGARAQSSGKEGQYTKERGFLAYYEVCQLQQQGSWNLHRDPTGGPYMNMGDQWVGYDDKDYITKKMELIKSEGFAGAMVWAIDLDDYKGVCGERWPLLSAIRRNLGLKSISSATIPLLPLPFTTTTTTTTSTTTEVTTQRTSMDIYSFQSSFEGILLLTAGFYTFAVSLPCWRNVLSPVYFLRASGSSIIL